MGTHSRATQWGAALTISAAVHLTAALWLPPPGSLNRAQASSAERAVTVEFMLPPEPDQPHEAEKPKEAPEPPPEPEPEPELDITHQAALGIDAMTPPSETWLGHEAYLEHRAAPAEFDQAAFTTALGITIPEAAPAADLIPPGAAPQPLQASAPSPPPPPPLPPLPLPMPGEGQEAQESHSPHPPIEPALPPEEAAPDDSSPVNPADGDRSLEDPLDEPDMSPGPRPEDSTEDSDADLARAVLQSLGMLAPLTEPAERAPAAEPAPQAAPAGAASPTSPEASIGAVSDKESDPTSVINVAREQWRLGQPVAGHGLELKPVKPRLTMLTAMTAATCNPLCELRFDASGKPVAVRLLEGSCDSRVDEAVISALYRWRAEGEPIRKLPPGETTAVRLRLVFNPRGKLEE